MKIKKIIMLFLAFWTLYAESNQAFSNRDPTPPSIVVFDGNRPALAVWEDGVFLMWPLSSREAFCLVGMYDKQEVADVLQSVEKSGFFDLPARDYIVPDSDWEVIMVRNGKTQVRRAWHGYLNPGFGGDLNSDQVYRDFVRSWCKVKGAITSLAPVEIYRQAQVEEISSLDLFRGVILKNPRQTNWTGQEKGIGKTDLESKQ